MGWFRKQLSWLGIRQEEEPPTLTVRTSRSEVSGSVSGTPSVSRNPSGGSSLTRNRSGRRSVLQHQIASPALSPQLLKRSISHLETGSVPAKCCGHVFLLHCDTSGIAADALLVPNKPSSTFPVGKVRRLKKKSNDDDRVSIYEGQLRTESFKDEESAVHGLQRTVRSYLNAAGSSLKGKASTFKRAKPLAALPLPGVGALDVADIVSDDHLIEWILPEAYRAANEYEIDVAICTPDVGAFQVMQVMRHICCPWDKGPFWMLSEHHRAEIFRLQKQALTGRLAVLFGAGISFPSGLPSWGGLLSELAVRAGFSEADQEALKTLGFLDQPTLIENEMGGSAPFKREVADCVRHGRYTPAHAILASMKIDAVTTNYDDLFEKAVSSTDGEEVMRLPWDAGKMARSFETHTHPRRLLKLHGCVSHPRSIVLTREDYMRYEDERRALRGLLHQALLERELLVVGFSMNDDNVHLIIDQVRQALDISSDGKKDGVDDYTMGTILTLVENPMFRRLWKDDFEVVSCADSYDDEPSWMHDIILDSLAAGLLTRKANDSFVLDESYAALLNESQLAIKQALEPLRQLADNDAVASSLSWVTIQKLLSSLGEGGVANAGVRTLLAEELDWEDEAARASGMAEGSLSTGSKGKWAKGGGEGEGSDGALSA